MYTRNRALREIDDATTSSETALGFAMQAKCLSHLLRQVAPSRFSTCRSFSSIRTPLDPASLIPSALSQFFFKCILINFHLRSSIQTSVSFRSFSSEPCRTLEAPRTQPARRPTRPRDSASRRPEKLTRPPRMLRAPRRARRRAQREQLETRPTRPRGELVTRPGLRKPRLGRLRMGQATFSTKPRTLLAAPITKRRMPSPPTSKFGV